MVQRKACDIVFIDMKLPTINGLETYLAIKEINPETVAIMITAHRQEVDSLMEQALYNSAYTFLYKPLDIAQVLKLVDEIWERQQKAG
jgi:DNA-binding NtrC family response regulator